MPGGKRKSKTKKNVKKQAGENKEPKEATNPTEQKTVTNDPTPAKANLDDAILVADLIHLNDFGNNNQSTGVKSPFDTFVSKFDAADQVETKESKPT